MSFQEALSRPSLSRERIIVTPGYSTDNIRQESEQLLIQAGVPTLLTELHGIVVTEFPDALIRVPRNSTSGIVFMELEWNSINGIECPNRYTYSYVKVSADPVTGALVISGREEEIIPKTIWSTGEGKAVLEDAIVIAYKDPMEMHGPPARL